MMPLFIPINNIDVNNSSYAVEELNMCEVNKDAVKYAIAAFIKSLNSVPKE